MRDYKELERYAIAVQHNWFAMIDFKKQGQILFGTWNALTAINIHLKTFAL
jgi:hypothetical protein